MRKCLYVDWYHDKAPAILERPETAAWIDRVDQYALGDVDLASYAALLVSTQLDQRHFASLAPRLTAFLGAGGTIVFNGHLAYPFLPELETFRPLSRKNVEALTVRRVRPHPVFEGVDMRDLTFRRGVAGFYGRGCNPPPPGAEVLNGLGPEACPVDWLWHRPGGGRIFMHAGNDVWMDFAGETSAARVAPQLVRWAAGAEVAA